METENYNGLIDKLSTTNDKQEIMYVCQEFTRILGFKYFLFGLCNPSSSLNDPDIQIITDYPSEWMKIYSEKRLLVNDPVVIYCQNHSVPLLWNKLQNMPEYNKPKYIATMKLAEKYGLRNGVSVPLKSQAGHFGIFSLSLDEAGEESETKCKNAIPDIQYFSSHALESLSSNSDSQKQNEEDKLLKNLTQREYECLFWACEGKTAWEISIILKISERTVLFHLTNATNKMGASNRQHAVAKALLLGIVKPKLSFSQSE